MTSNDENSKCNPVACHQRLHCRLRLDDAPLAGAKSVPIPSKEWLNVAIWAMGLGFGIDLIIRRMQDVSSGLYLGKVETVDVQGLEIRRRIQNFCRYIVLLTSWPGIFWTIYRATIKTDMQCLMINIGRG